MTRPEHIERARALHATIMNLYFAETIAPQIVNTIAAEFALVEAEAVERCVKVGHDAAYWKGTTIGVLNAYHDGNGSGAASTIAAHVAAAIRALKETP